MRELPRDLVTILRTEARNQRTPPIDYVIAEDGGRMVHRPEPDIAMAELLEEAAAALTTERAALAEARKALEPFAKAGELFPGEDADFDQCIYKPAAGDGYAIYGNHLRAARRALEGGQEDG